MTETALPGVVLAMRYPDDVGLMWTSAAWIYSGAVDSLRDAAQPIICFPALTDRPAFPTPWAARVVCDWYDTHSAASRARIQSVTAEHGVRVVEYCSCPGDTLDFRFLRRLGIRTINYELDSFPILPRQPWVKRMAKLVLRRGLKLGIHDCYVPNAHHQRRFLIEFACLPPSRVQSVVNGIDLEKFRPGPRPDPASLGLPASDYYVVSVSQARPEKRIDVLVDAVREVFRRRPELSLTYVHVGDGQCLESLRVQAAPLGERCQFVGARSDVVPYLRLATIFAHAAERESFGYAITEAMACRKPVVATRSQGPCEIIEPGETGVLVDQGDVSTLAAELLALIDSPERREKMGAAGREHCERLYDGRRQSHGLAQVMREQLSRR